MNSIIPLVLEASSYKTTCYCALNSYDLADAEKLANTYFSASEINYLANLQVNKRRLTYLLGRIAAKQALQELCNIDNPQLIAIQHGIFEQPIVLAASNIAPSISISHSDKWGAAIAFQSHYPMGIDIEELNIERIDTLKSQLSPSEIQLFSFITPPLHAFTMAWTMKEALSKILKTGLTTSFAFFEISSIARQGDVYISKFKYLPQYQAITMCEDNIVLSLVLPQQLQLREPNILKLHNIGRKK